MLTRLRSRAIPVACSAALAAGLLGGVGCSSLDTGFATGQPAAASTAVAENVFADPELPDGYDAKWARVTLKDIPEDPAVPGAAAGSAAPELPRQALRHLTEARRLFDEQRYSETIAEAEQVVRYNAGHAEANRLAALASLMSGKQEPAQQYAKSVIKVKPDDLACHYVLARVADKGEETQVALQEYRIALKCPVGAADASYRILTQYHLGLLLNQLGFYKAATDQLEAFQQAAAALGKTESDNPELAGIVRLKRLEVLRTLADAYETLRQYDAAAQSLARAAQLVPDDDDLRVRHIKNLVRARHFDEAAKQAAQLASADKASAKSVQLLMAVHRAAGHLDRGLAALQQLVTQVPENVDAALFYADALVEARRFDQAVGVLNGVVRKHPDASLARWKLVAIHRFQGDLNAWLWALAGQLAAEPADASRALSELRELPKDQATHLLDRTLAANDATASAPADEHDAGTWAGRYFCLAVFADRLDRVEQARQLYIRSLESKGDFLPAATGMATLYIARCQWDKALDALRGIEPKDATAQSRVAQLTARCYDGLDDFPEAVKAYEQALRARPDDTETMLLLARMHDRSSRPKEAVRVYEKAITAAPELMLARELLVMNLLNRWNEDGNLKQALAQVTEMQKKAPEDAATLRTMALVRVLLRSQDLASYVKVLTALVEREPNNLQSRRTLCMALYRMGDSEAVKRELKPLLEAEPCDPEGNELLAMTLMRQLQVEAVDAHLAKCLQWYPYRESFLRYQGEVKLVEQDYAGAEKLWNRLLALKYNEDRHPVYCGRLISTYLQAGWYDRARTAAEKWLAEASDVPAYRSYLLAADAAEGKYDDYLKRCRAWLEKDRNDQQAREWLLGIGDLPGQATGGLIGAGRKAEAVTQATTWAAESADDPAAQRVVLDTLEKVRRFGDMIEIARAELVQTDKVPQQLAALQTLAEAYLMAKQYDQAITTVKEIGARAAAITQADLSFGTDQLMVSYLAQSKRYEDAIAEGNKLLSELTERETRLQRLAGDGKDATRAVQIAKETERLRQQRSMVLRSISFVYTKQNSREQTIDCLRQALKLTPNDAGINNDLGYTLADAGLDLDHAESMLSRAVAEVLWTGVGEDDRQAAFTDSLGWLCYKRGRFPEAKRWLELSAKMEDGEDAVIYDHLGDAEWRTGHADAAGKAWQKCLALHDRQVAEGKSDGDAELTRRVKAKLAELQAKGKPAVATSVAD